MDVGSFSLKAPGMHVCLDFKGGVGWCGWDSWWVPSGEDGNGTGSYGPFHWSDRVRAVFDDGA